jgi:hypothetical protein
MIGAIDPLASKHGRNGGPHDVVPVAAARLEARQADPAGLLLDRGCDDVAPQSALAAGLVLMPKCLNTVRARTDSSVRYVVESGMLAVLPSDS